MPIRFTKKNAVPHSFRLISSFLFPQTLPPIFTLISLKLSSLNHVTLFARCHPHLLISLVTLITLSLVKICNCSRFISTAIVDDFGEFNVFFINILDFRSICFKSIDFLVALKFLWVFCYFLLVFLGFMVLLLWVFCCCCWKMVIFRVLTAAAASRRWPPRLQPPSYLLKRFFHLFLKEICILMFLRSFFFYFEVLSVRVSGVYFSFLFFQIVGFYSYDYQGILFFILIWSWILQFLIKIEYCSRQKKKRILLYSFFLFCCYLCMLLLLLFSFDCTIYFLLLLLLLCCVLLSIWHFHSGKEISLAILCCAILFGGLEWFGLVWFELKWIGLFGEIII